MTTETSPPLSAEATAAIARSCAGRWADTEALMTIINFESSRDLAWRPARAGALVALENAPRVWMHLEEFERFMKLHRLRGVHQRKITDMGVRRLKAVREGSPISRIESLACAHFHMGFELPIPVGDCDAFAEWFAARFGTAGPVGTFLQTRPDYITSRMRGYTMNRGKRVPITPEASYIRALDWVWRCGPFSPFGDRAPVAYWPGQDVS